MSARVPRGEGREGKQRQPRVVEEDVKVILCCFCLRCDIVLMLSYICVNDN